MEKVEIISKNPFNPSPRGEISDINQLVGREEIIISFWEFARKASENKFIPLILRAPYGGGKTTILNWLTKTIEEKNEVPKYILNKKILVVYTKLPHPSIESITSTFLDSVKLKLKKTERTKLISALNSTRKKLEKKDIENSSIYHKKAYNNALDVLYSFGYDVIIHIMDEFEAISEVSTEECRGFLHEFRDFIDEIGNRPLMLTLGCTDEAYRLMEEIHPALVSRVPEEFRTRIDAQLRFTLENTLDFVATKIESVRESISDVTNPYFPFERNAIELLYDRTRGNIRTIEQTCYFAIEKMLKKGSKIDEKEISEALHQVISQKSGEALRESIYNVIDDQKNRTAVVGRLRKGRPEDLKEMVFQGFKIFLAKQNFDFTFEREFEFLSQNVGFSKVNTQAYRTIPVNLIFLPTLTPKNLGYSDVVDIDELRKNEKAGLAILLRVSDNKSATEFPLDNVLEISISKKHFEQIAILPYLSHIDAEKIGRNIEDELKIITNINRWIREKLEKGEVVGERFRQYELSVYLHLWRIGDFFSSQESIYKLARKRNRKYSKATMFSRLKNLYVKKMVIRKDDDLFKWQISPLMQKIHKIIVDEFKGNPVTPLDIKSFFLGGSIVTLQRYLQLMVTMGLLEKVKVAGRTAYKNLDSKIEILIEEKQDLSKQFSSNSSSLPNMTFETIKNKITLINESIKNSKKNLKDENPLLALANVARSKELFEEIQRIYEGIQDQSILIEKEYQQINESIQGSNHKIEKCKGLGIDVATISPRIEMINRENKRTYQTDYKVYGKVKNVIEKQIELRTQIDSIDKNLTKTLELHGKLINNLKKSRQLLNSINLICNSLNIPPKTVKENLEELNNLLVDAEKALDEREFTQAEFLFLKILQSEIIRKALFEANRRFSEIHEEIDQLRKTVSISSRISHNTELVIENQEVEQVFQKTKKCLEDYDLMTAIPNIEMLEKLIEKNRAESLTILINWANSIFSQKQNPTTPYELSKMFGLPFETVLQAIILLLKNNQIQVIKR